MEERHRRDAYRIGEAVAAVGVILSLLFVGVQIRQTAAISRAQAAQELAATSQDFLLTLAANPDAHRAFLATFYGMDEVTSDEQSRASVIMIAFLRRAESAFLQVRGGLLPESALSAYGTEEIVPRFENRRFRELWSRRRSTFNPAFAEYLERRSEHISVRGDSIP